MRRRMSQRVTKEQLSIRPGDTVQVTRDDGTKEVRKATSEPWQLGHGENGTDTRNSLIEAIPEPQRVRERLVAALREVQILRQLLKVSERAAKNNGQKAELRNA